MAEIAAVAGILASVGGTIVSAAGAQYQGEAQQQALNYEARLKERKASEEMAVGERKAAEKTREATLFNSRQQAVAAASGAGATDPTVLELMGNATKEGALNAGYAMYQGQAAADDLNMSAGVDRISGNNARKAGNITAVGNILTGISTFGSKYGGGGFGSASVQQPMNILPSFYR